MNILAFDTTMGACSVAVLRENGAGGEQLYSAHDILSRGHAEALVPMIEEVMGEAEIGFGLLHRIAVTSGPGTFTGIRVGIATARGLALAANIPVVSETSLRVLACKILQDGDGEGTGIPDCDQVAVAVDAWRGEIYFQLFDISGVALCAPQAVNAAAAAAGLPETRVLAVGSGALQLKEAALSLGRTVTAIAPGLQPDAKILAGLASELTITDAPVRPCYLRAPDAKPQIGKAISRASH